MSEFGEHPAAAFLRTISIDETTTVPLKRVMRQRAVFADLYAASLLQPSLDVLLGAACRVAADGCEVPFAKVLEHRPADGQFLVRAGVGWQPGVVGNALASDAPDNPAGESLLTRQPVAVADVRTRQDYHLPPIYPNHGIVSAVNVPILGVGGFHGVLEVDCREDHVFDALDISFLASIAGIIADATERVRREAALQAAHDARAVLLREHHHRVRNSYQSLMARLQRHAQRATSEESRQRFRDVERRVFALASLYDHLVGLGLAEDRLDLGKYLCELCDRIRIFHAVDESAIELICESAEAEIRCDLDTCTALGIVVNELVANAIEHAFGPTGGRIEVRLARGAEGPVLTVADNGKGFAGAQPESIGLAGIGPLVSSIGGTMALKSERGTVWTIALPRSGES